MKIRREGRVVSTVALLFATGIMLTSFGTLYERARTGARLVASRSVAVETLPNITYKTAGGAALKLDIYRPKGAAKAAMPAIVLIHGGSWRSGSKEDLDQIARPLAQQGYVVANVDYRLAPSYKFPAQIEDCKAAVRWLRRHANTYQVDTRRIATIGFSAGAHLAAMLGTTSETAFLDGDRNDVSAKVDAVVSISGPFDFTTFQAAPDNEGLAYWLGGSYAQRTGAYRAASPLLTVSKASPPMFLVDGLEDTLVKPENDTKMAAALRKAGVEVEVLHVKNAGHVLMQAGKEPIQPSYPVVFFRVADFLNRHSG